MSFSIYASGLDGAKGINFDSSDNLYIANSGDDTIIEVDTLGNKTIFETSFDSIQNLIFDNSDTYLYVMDDSNTLYKVDSDGYKTPFVTNLSAHYFGMTFDSSDNLYYSSFSTPEAINKIDVSGNTTAFIETDGLLYPIGLDFDTMGNLYVANFETQYISKYDSNGTMIDAEYISSPDGTTWVNLIIDEDDNIYAVYHDSTTAYLNKYDSDGNFISTIYVDPTKSIFGLAFDSIDNLYFTSDSSTIIIKFDPYAEITCFKEDAQILTDNGYKLVQNLRKGDLVKTLMNDFKPIDVIGKSQIYHPASKERIKDQLYVCSQSEYPEIFEPLVITGCHSILVDDFISDEQRENVIKVNGDTYVTDKKYRLPSCADPRAIVYEEPGNYTIYHLALENDDYYMNYGIYANGLLVESCSKRYLKELSNMTLIE